MNKYEDIINLSRPESKHPRMSLYQRSAQFAPFAALTGYEGQVKETARLTDQKIELDEEMKTLLDLKIQIVQALITKNPEIEITYFIKDENKDGGKYTTIFDNIKKIDDYNGQFIMSTGLKIDVKEILSIDGEIFKNII